MSRHRSACRTRRFPDDDRLRAGGFEIAARRGNREAVWAAPDGREVLQRVALAELDLLETLALGLVVSERGRPCA